MIITGRNEERLKEHFEKHGIEMGFDSAEEYQKAASDAANDPNALHKLEKEDGDVDLNDCEKVNNAITDILDSHQFQ